MHKLLSFWTFNFFIGTLICVVLEGGEFAIAGTHGTGTVINQLMAFTTSSAGGFFGIVAATTDFFQGIFRIILWDYSFYSGGWELLRWFWLVTLSPAILWEIGRFLVEIAAAMLRVF